MDKPLRIALPKGRMSDDSVEYFYRHGITSFSKFSVDRELIIADKEKGLEFLLIRSKDVGAYVEQGAADIGVLGHDVLAEHNFEVLTPVALPFGACRLSIAYPNGKTDWQNKRNIRVATKYPKLTSRYFFERGFNITIVELYGSIEIAPLTGISDVIVDLVSTGNTLKANGLSEEESILDSTARLIVNPVSWVFRRAEISKMIDTLTAF